MDICRSINSGLFRRLSAISVAARVSAERLEDGSVGYAIRGENKQGKNTKLLFCTTGVVLRRLGSGDTLEGVSHIVVDEVGIPVQKETTISTRVFRSTSDRWTEISSYSSSRNC